MSRPDEARCMPNYCDEKPRAHSYRPEKFVGVDNSTSHCSRQGSTARDWSSPWPPQQQAAASYPAIPMLPWWYRDGGTGHGIFLQQARRRRWCGRPEHSAQVTTKQIAWNELAGPPT